MIVVNESINGSIDLFHVTFRFVVVTIVSQGFVVVATRTRKHESNRVIRMMTPLSIKGWEGLIRFGSRVLSIASSNAAHLVVKISQEVAIRLLFRSDWRSRARVLPGRLVTGVATGYMHKSSAHETRGRLMSSVYHRKEY